MNAKEKVSKAVKLSRAIEKEDIFALFEILDMVGPMFDNLEVLELMEIANVRLADTIKELGIGKE